MVKDPEKTKVTKTELELEHERAQSELAESRRGTLKKAYQKAAAGLREEVLAFITDNPGLTLAEVAEKFGVREHTIRAWKAHRTMGTYRGRPAPAAAADEEPLFAMNKKQQRKLGFVLRRRHTGFIHYFDKTPPGIVCPHFHILAFANGCPFQCDYCYLYLTLRHWPEPTVFSNTARMYQEIRDWLFATQQPSVLNAGELSDSLIWDHEIALTANLIPLFAAQNRHRLLLLTKSANISELAKLEPTPSVIVSFSVNAAEVSEKYEKKSARPKARLMAAQRLKSLGWRIRLRVDPVIPVPGWKDYYGALADEIAALKPETVTLGSLRFFPTLKNHAPNPEIFELGVDEGDPDGRMRIPFALRREMYRHLIPLLKIPRLGLCKETEKMHQALGFPGPNQFCNCSYD